MSSALVQPSPGAEFGAPKVVGAQTLDPHSPSLLTPRELGLMKDSVWKGEAGELTTGNHMMDCLAVWYGPELDEETAAIFQALDSKVRAAIGELAMVVLRREGRGRHGTVVESQYQIGRLIGNVGLYMELLGAQVKLPTEGSSRFVTLPSGEPGLVELPSYHPMVVHQMHDVSSKLLEAAFVYNSVDLVNHRAGPTIDLERTDLVGIDSSCAIEAQKPPLEIIIGNTCVRDFLDTDPTLETHGRFMGLSIPNFLLRHFDG